MKRLLILTAALFLTPAFAQQTLTVAGFPNLTDAVQAAATIYEEQNPDVNIEVVSKEFVDHHTALLTALASGAGAPDVTAIEIGFISQFASAGGLVDLSGAPYNADEATQDIVDYALEQATTSDGRLIAIPTDLGPGTMFYRRDILEQMGTTPEEIGQDWDSYLEFGRALKEQGLILIPNAARVYHAYIRSNAPEGEGLFFDAEGNPVVTSERFAEAFELAKTIRDEGMDLNVTDWSPEWAAAFQSGQAATELFGFWLTGWLESTVPDTSGLWGVTTLPNESYVSWGGSFYAIPEGSDNKELAWDFIQFLTTNPDTQMLAFETIGAFPSDTEAYDNAIFEEPVEFLGGQQAYQVAIDIANEITGQPVNPNDNLADEIVGDQLTQVLTEGKDISAALEEAQRLIERRVSRR